MIINIVGTMGAGKTTLVRKFMAQDELGGALPTFLDDDEKRQPYGYFVRSNRKDCDSPAFVIVVGNYEHAFGGCDDIRTQREVRGRISLAHAHVDHVLFEGIAVTRGVGTYFKFLRDLAPSDHLFAFLHPPVEVCVERVLADKGFDLEGVVRHHAFVTRAIERARQFGAPYTLLNWKRALPDLNAAFGIRVRGGSKRVA
jgi:hypothetical protein